MRYQVSIPHRYGKNEIRRPLSLKKYVVSIPHRYGKNELYDGDLVVDEWFPFLIGTVRTFLAMSRYLLRWLFPFLIGTVRTQALKH